MSTHPGSGHKYDEAAPRRSFSNECSWSFLTNVPDHPRPVADADWSVNQDPCVRTTNARKVRDDAMAESTITAKGQTTVPADIRALVDA